MKIDALNNWEQILNSTPHNQIEHLQQFFETVSSMNEQNRRYALRILIECTEALSALGYRQVTASGLNAWLKMVPSHARRVVRSFQAVTDEGSGNDAWRRVVVTRAISKELPDCDQLRLDELFHDPKSHLPPVSPQNHPDNHIYDYS